MKGEIEVYSMKNVGTIFIFYVEVEVLDTLPSTNNRTSNLFLSKPRNN